MTQISQPIDYAISETLNSQLEINIHGYPYVICYITVPTGATLVFEGSPDYGTHYTSIDITDLSTVSDVSDATVSGFYAINTVYRTIRITTTISGSSEGRIVGTAFHSTVENFTGGVDPGEILDSVVNSITEDISIADLKPFFEHIFYAMIDPRLFITTLTDISTADILATPSSMVCTGRGTGYALVTTKKQ